MYKMLQCVQDVHETLNSMRECVTHSYTKIVQAHSVPEHLYKHTHSLIHVSFSREKEIREQSAQC